ncbi:hypothetical protein EV424DRAFT_1534992 [Suillus variegatus]|nr:hypothetical protein EV424DRAFT_1534992 [Suillus variegatus]
MKRPQLELLKTDCNMPGVTWTTPEQKAFLEKYYNPFLEAQLQATVTRFWIPLYAEWFTKWPEVNELFKGQTVPVTLSEEQNIALGKVVDARHKKIRTWFNNRSQKSELRVHEESVQEGVKKEIETGALVTKEGKLLSIRQLTRKAYEASSNEVHALCKAKVQEERDSKAQVRALEGLRGEGSVPPTNEQYATALEECTGPISQFMQAIQNMTGFEWTVIGAGPDPRLSGKLNALIYHTGLNRKGQNWRDCTPDFIERHLNPYLEFVGTIFPEHVRKTRALDYIPQSPPSAAVIPPTTDFVGAASTSNTSPLVGIPHSQALAPVHVRPDESFIPSDGFWTFDESNTESLINETEVLLPAHPHTQLLYNESQSLSYNPPPSSSQTGTEVLLSAHPAASTFDPYTPSLYNDTLSLSYSLPSSSSQTGTPISSWNREVWDQQVSSPLCSSTPHFQTNHHITDSLTSNSDALRPSYIFPNSHLPRSGSEPVIPAAPMTPAAPATPAAPVIPAAPTTPAAPAPIDEHLD